MIWQAGGKPVHGRRHQRRRSTSPTRAPQKYTATWQKLIDEKLLAPVAGWSDDWYKGLGDGTIATLAIGAWMPANLESGVKAGAGKWRVAPMPQWTGRRQGDRRERRQLAGRARGRARTRRSPTPSSKYANADDGVQTRVDERRLPGDHRRAPGLRRS